MNRYIRVGWRHNNSEDPVTLYSELDEASWELRKVEVYSDGRMGYAAENVEFGGARLGTVPVPPLFEIECEPEFDPAEISADAFESVWRAATGQGAHPRK